MELNKKAAENYKFFIGKQEVSALNFIERACDLIDDKVLSELEQVPRAVFKDEETSKRFFAMNHNMKKFYVRKNISGLLISDFIRRLNIKLEKGEDFAQSFGGDGQTFLTAVNQKSNSVYSPYEFESRIKDLNMTFVVDGKKYSPLLFLDIIKKSMKKEIYDSLKDKDSYKSPEEYEEFLVTPDNIIEREIEDALKNDLDEFLDVLKDKRLAMMKIDNKEIIILDVNDPKVINKLKEEHLEDLLNHIINLKEINNNSSREEDLEDEILIKPTTTKKRFN